MGQQPAIPTAPPAPTAPTAPTTEAPAGIKAVMIAANADNTFTVQSAEDMQEATEPLATIDEALNKARSILTGGAEEAPPEGPDGQEMGYAEAFPKA
jgi:hypothetical protein